MATKEIIIVRTQRVGRDATPWLEPQRKRFASVQKEAREHFRDSTLKGEAKVRAMNAFVSERLKRQ